MLLRDAVEEAMECEAINMSSPNDRHREIGRMKNNL